MILMRIWSVDCSGICLSILKKDQKLAEIYTQIPKNAYYLSPEIESNVIEIMSEVVRE